MALLKIWEGSRGIMRLLVIQFVCWLGWFSTFALAQFDISEGVAGSVTFPALGITCVANLAVFVTTLIRGRLDLEMGARDVLDILLSPKLQNIKRIKHGYGLTTCMQEDAVIGGGGDQGTASAEESDAEESEESDAEESDVHAAPTRGTETASTEGNGNTSASTEREDLQTASTADIVIHIDSLEGQAAAAAAKAKAAVAAEEAAKAKAAAAAAAEKEKQKKAKVAALLAEAAEKTAKATKAAAEAAEAAVRKAEAAKAAAEAAERKVAGSTAETGSHIDSPEGQAAAAAAKAKTAKTTAAAAKAKTTAAAAAAKAATAAAADKEEAAKTAKAAKAATAAAKAANAAEKEVEKAENAAEKAEKAAEKAAILFARQNGLKSTGVIMLSNDTANWSMKQFMKSNAYVVQSIVLRFLPLKRALNDRKVRKELTSGVTIKSCECRRRCHCIVFRTMEEITHMLDTRMPATLTRLSNTLCLLPCSTCLRKGCHECNRENLLRAESEADEGQPMRQRVVSDILDNIRAGDIPAGKLIAICIPMNDAQDDDWTKLLLKSLRSKDAEGRGVTNMAAEALEGYLAGGRGSEEGRVEYDIFSFVVPRLTEVLINLVLTFWFRVDGFSSALVARRTVRNYLVDTKSSGFAANTFLTEALVKCNGDNSQVCQVLTFRGRDWLCITTFISVGCVNVICALGWALLISFEGGSDTSQRPSLPIVAVIIAAIGSPWVLLSAAVAGGNNGDLLRIPVQLFRQLFSNLAIYRGHCPHHRYPRTVAGFVVRLLNFLLMTGRWFVTVFAYVWLIPIFVVISPVLCPVVLVRIAGPLIERRNQPYTYPLIVTGLLFETACLVSWSALAGALGIKGFGSWLYAALQILIWVKWATGSYFLSLENSSEFFGRDPHRVILIFYSSAFWLNAVLAGVRCKWEAWPWKHNHLF